MSSKWLKIPDSVLSPRPQMHSCGRKKCFTNRPQFWQRSGKDFLKIETLKCLSHSSSVNFKPSLLLIVKPWIVYRLSFITIVFKYWKRDKCHKSCKLCTLTRWRQKMSENQNCWKRVQPSLFYDDVCILWKRTSRPNISVLLIVKRTSKSNVRKSPLWFWEFGEKM